MSDLIGRKPILCLDFDGVCHSYTSGWKGASVIPDAPVDGLFEFLLAASDAFEINVFSSRSNQEGGIEAMKQWFAQHFEKWLDRFTPGVGIQIPPDATPETLVGLLLKFPTDKPPAFVGIDDRVLTFTGKWPTAEALRIFQPWNKLGVSGKATEN